MELNLLFLPLLGGYIFYSRFNGTAYYAKRAGGHSLLFGAAACGLAFLLFARLIVLATPVARDDPDPWIGLGMHAMPGVAVAALMGLVIFRTGAVGPHDPDAEETNAKWLLGSLIGGVLWAVAANVLLAEPPLAWLVPSSLVVVLAVIGTIWLHMLTETPAGAVGFRVAAFLGAAALALPAFATQIATIDRWWQKFSPYPDSGTAFLACVLAAIAWWPLNLLYSYTVAVSRLHGLNRTSALDKFLHDAAFESETVLLSMADGKFYVGVLDWTPPNPQATSSYVRLLPYASGYRDEATKELRFTTYYDVVYEELANDPDVAEPDVESFLKILPVGSVVSATLFDPKLYVKFDRARQRLEQEGDERRDAIAQAAYRRAEQRGFAPGSELDDWLAAEREMDGEATE